MPDPMKRSYKGTRPSKVNQSVEISRNFIENVISKYKELPVEEKCQPEAIKLIVDQYDYDNSGMLNFKEFLRFLKDMELAGSDDDQQIKTKFELLMKIGEEDDKSGAVGDQEIIQYIQ